MKMANELGIVDVQSLEKSELKKKIKTAVKTKMEEEIQVAAKGSTKLRYLNKVVENSSEQHTLNNMEARMLI